MRLSDVRASAVLAMAVVLATIAGLAVIRDGTATRDHDSIVRSGRGTSQRLETADGLNHEWEVPELLLSAATQTHVAAPASVPTSPRANVHAPPGSPAVPAVSTAPTGALLLLSARYTPALLGRPLLPVQGRAPPA